MVGLNNKTTQVHYSEFHAFCNHQVYIYFIYVFLYFYIQRQQTAELAWEITLILSLNVSYCSAMPKCVFLHQLTDIEPQKTKLIY